MKNRPSTFSDQPYTRVIAVFFMSFYAITGFSAKPVEVEKLYPENPIEYEWFGTEVAIDKDTIMISGTVSAFVFSRENGTWVRKQKLLPVAYPSNFAWNEDGIDIDGAVAVIGDEDNGASIYRFNGASWVFETLLVDDVSEHVQFSRGVDIDGDTVLATAKGYNNGSGAAYVFVESAGAWSQQAILTNPDPTQDNDSFGGGLALEGDVALIAAPGEIVAGTRVGVVYVYTRNAGVWTYTDQLVPTGGIGGQDFGEWVVMDQGIIAVSAFSDNNRVGAVYIFENIAGTWTQTQKLEPSDSPMRMWFGLQLSLDNNKLIVGAQEYSVPFPSSGAAYLFERINNSWVETARLTPNTPHENDYFGYGIGVSGKTIIVSAVGDDDIVSGGGATYVFEISLTVTPEGEDVIVQPPVEDLNGDTIEDAPELTFTYEDIDTAGDTTITVVDPSPETSTPPQGFRVLGLDDGSAMFDFHTTATMAPESMVEICIDYSVMGIAGDPADLIFAHEVEGVWMDITSSNDTVNQIICGVTDSFSFFAIVESADPEQLLSDLVDAVSVLNAKHGIVNSLDAKLVNAEDALFDAKTNNDHSAINVLINGFINHVEAQSGKAINTEEADALILRANEIVGVIEGGFSL